MGYAKCKKSNPIASYLVYVASNKYKQTDIAYSLAVRITDN